MVKCFRKGLALALLAWFLSFAGSVSVAAQESSDLDAFFRNVTDGRADLVKDQLRRHPEWANAELFMGIRPLYRASVLGRDEVLLALLAAGADVSATTERGTHPLHAAADHGYDSILTQLLDAGSDVNVTMEDALTPLHLAVRSQQSEAVALLLSRGASTTAADSQGRTPLHYAAGLGKLAMCRALVDKGANLDAVDTEGFSALGLCRTWKRNDFAAVAAYLEGLGALDLRPAWAFPAPADPNGESADKATESEP